VLGDRRLRRPTPVLVLLAMPLLVPAYATGTGLAEWFLRLGLAGGRLGLVLAHLTVVLPYVVLVLAAGFGERLAELEEMAATTGLGQGRRLALVTLPAVRPTLAAACLLGFLVSWSQYGLSLAVGGGLPMLPILLLPFVGTDPQVAAALSLLFLAPAVAALALAARATRRPR
jgi:putative spermidine/putrescine transport system permease protein